jgi:hypothetical protein
MAEQHEDNKSEHHEGSDGKKKLSTKQKLLIVGAVLAVGLGIWTARRNASAEEETVGYKPTYEYDDVLYIDPPTTGGVGGGSSSGGSSSSGNGSSSNGGAAGSGTDYGYGSGSGSASGGSSVWGGSSSQSPVYYGNGGANYYELDQAGRDAMIANSNRLKSGDQEYLMDELARTDAAIKNREAAGMNTSDQLKYRDQLEAQAATNILTKSGSTSSSGMSGYTAAAAITNSGERTVVSTASSVDNAGLGIGGANYNTASADVKKKMEQDAARIAGGDTAYIASEQARAQEVIDNRKATGLDTTDQQKYLNSLNQAASAASMPSGTTTVSSPSVPAAQSASAANGTATAAPVAPVASSEPKVNGAVLAELMAKKKAKAN